MRNVTSARRILLTVGVLGLAGLTACSDDSGGDDAEPPPTASEAGGADDTSADGAAAATVTGEEICNGVTGADVGDVLGLDVLAAQAYDTATPQCSYAYDSASGATSNVTVSSLRPDGDLGGRTGEEAFEYTLELNQALAGGTDVDESEVDAGDRAVRLTGTSMHLGIVEAGGQVLTIIVPANDASPDDVDALIVQVADQLG